MSISTREVWLLAAIDKLAPVFESKGFRVPTGCLVSCGFPSTGIRSNHIGQCWSRSSSSTGANQIFISPGLADSIEVLDTLVHELVHAVDDCQNKHGREFKKIAIAIGLKGPMRSAQAGVPLLEILGSIAKELGPYPHGQLMVVHKRRVSKPRPRAQCPECDYQVPMLKKYIAIGAPICPIHKIQMNQVGAWCDFE